jgi:hypothetical protein
MARPKRQFNEEIIQRIEEMALNGCQNGTISNVLNIPNTTLVRRFGKLLTKKRCERKELIRKNQTVLSKNNPAMAIFLGKNELGQTDRQEITDGKQQATEPISPELAEDIRAVIQRHRLKELNKQAKDAG